MFMRPRSDEDYVEIFDYVEGQMDDATKLIKKAADLLYKAEKELETLEDSTAGAAEKIVKRELEFVKKTGDQLGKMSAKTSKSTDSLLDAYVLFKGK